MAKRKGKKKKKKNEESVLILILGHQTGWQLAANNLRLNIITTDYGIAVGGYVPFHFHFPATSNTNWVRIYVTYTYIYIYKRIQVSIKHVGSRLTANIVTIIVLRSGE